MKKFSALAVAGIAASAICTAAPSHAEGLPGQKVSTPVTGNLQYTAPPQYWCSKGVPNYFVAVRAVKTTEVTVTASEPAANSSLTLGPVTHTKPLTIFSTKNQAGKTFMLYVKGNTTGSSFSIKVSIPATCKGLPTITPNGSVVPPTTKPSKPAGPSMPATPVKPGVPTKPAMPAKPSVPAQPAMPAPSKPTVGPKVNTDHVSASSSMTGEAALAGVALIGAGGLLIRRRSARD